jgi:hypothetical protein
MTSTFEQGGWLTKSQSFEMGLLRDGIEYVGSPLDTIRPITGSDIRLATMARTLALFSTAPVASGMKTMGGPQTGPFRFRPTTPKLVLLQLDRHWAMDRGAFVAPEINDDVIQQ